MSVALAPVAAPTVEVLTRLESLHADLARPDLELTQAAHIHDQATVLLAYAREANLAFEVAWQAVEARLRAERRVGELLDRVIADTVPARPYRAPRQQYLPRGFLAQIGLSGTQASRWRLISRIPDAEFEQRLQASREARRELSTMALVRASVPYGHVHAGGRPATPTIMRLTRILTDMRKIRSLSTPGEKALAEKIVAVGSSWANALQAAAVHRGVPQRGIPHRESGDITCLLCGRAQPPGKPARCPSCAGAWVTV